MANDLGGLTRREFLRRGAAASATTAVGVAVSKPARSLMSYLFGPSKAYAQEKNGANESPDTSKDYNRVNIEGLKLYSSGDYGSAIRKFEEAVKIDPNIHAAYINMASAYLDSSRVDEAIPLYHIGIQKSPQHSKLAHKGLAEAYKIKGLKKEALEHLTIYERMSIVNGKIDPVAEKFIRNFKANM